MPNPTANSSYLAVTVHLSALETAKTVRVCSPVTGDVVGISFALDEVVDGADADLTTSIDGTAITAGIATFALSGTAVGQRVYAVPTGANAVLRGQNLEAATDGGPTSTGEATVCFLIEQR